MINDLIILYPKPSIILIAFIVSLVSMLITKKLTDQERMKELKKIQKECNERLKKNKEDKEAFKKIMECSGEMMKQSLKPMFITFIPLILLIFYLRSVFASTELASSWIWWYIIAAITSSLILKKALKVV